MKQDNDILSRISHNDGLRVPEGYFEDFAARMAASLPVNELAEGKAVVAPAPRTFWMRVRPYAYMAAMFAGIWCMLKMFNMMANGDHDLSIDRNPVMVAALSNSSFVNDYVYGDIDECEILDGMYDEGVDFPEMFDEVSDDSEFPAIDE